MNAVTMPKEMEVIMGWEFKNDRPIYSQILEHIQLNILSGYYKSGEKLPSVRELAAEAAVNPNTMQKALIELERVGLVHAERTTGRYITDDKELILSIKNDTAKEYMNEFVMKMKKIGFTDKEIFDIINKELN